MVSQGRNKTEIFQFSEHLKHLKKNFFWWLFSLWGRPRSGTGTHCNLSGHTLPSSLLNTIELKSHALSSKSNWNLISVSNCCKTLVSNSWAIISCGPWKPLKSTSLFLLNGFVLFILEGSDYHIWKFQYTLQLLLTTKSTSIMKSAIIKCKYCVSFHDVWWQIQWQIVKAGPIIHIYKMKAHTHTIYI